MNEKICQAHFLDLPTEYVDLVVIDSEECHTCKLEDEYEERPEWDWLKKK